MTPEQKRRNMITALILVGLVIAIFLWAVFGHVLSAA
ncbi:cytochrome oxidase small assembly protein [Advenella kashmirensis]